MLAHSCSLHMLCTAGCGIRFAFSAVVLNSCNACMCVTAVCVLFVPAAGWAGVQSHQAACAAAQLAARAGAGTQAPAACGHSADVPAQVCVVTCVFFELRSLQQHSAMSCIVSESAVGILNFYLAAQCSIHDQAAHLACQNIARPTLPLACVRNG